MCRKFLHKACSYMCAYQEIVLVKKEKEEEIVSNNEIMVVEQKLSHTKIEKIRRKYKMHRDSNCRDCKFIELKMKKCIVIK